MPGTQSSKMHRERQILKGAVRAAHDKGYQHITQKDIAAYAGISTGLITYHFDNMDNLRRELMMFAVQERDLKILAQGIIAGDTVALAAPATAKANAITALGNA